MTFNYTVKPPEAAGAPVGPQPVVEYGHKQFLLDLPGHWKYEPSEQENRFNWHSDQEAATLTISTDFYAFPEGELPAIAEEALANREQALAKSTSRTVTVLQRSIRPHHSAAGLELKFGAQVEGECTYLYLGYVTQKRIFNLTLVSTRGQALASALYTTVTSNLRVKMP